MDAAATDLYDMCQQLGGSVELVCQLVCPDEGH